jgi:sulfate adenylyltransferase subunit 1 (EFTu-like GTPase family)
MELLRFTTAGSVDDGKSTLIGRILYDSKSIFQDQLDAVERASKQKGEDKLNLALVDRWVKSLKENKESP